MINPYIHFFVIAFSSRLFLYALSHKPTQHFRAESITEISLRLLFI